MSSNALQTLRDGVCGETARSGHLQATELGSRALLALQERPI